MDFLLIVIILMGIGVIAIGAFMFIRWQRSQSAGDLPPPDIGELVDYTSQPEEEPKTLQERLSDLSTPVKILLGLVPVLLLLIIGVVVVMSLPEPATDVQTADEPGTNVEAAAPSIDITQARMSNDSTINLRADTTLSDGTDVQVELLADDEPLAWLDSEATSIAVENGSISARLDKASDAETAEQGAELQIRLSAEVNDDTVDATAELDLRSYADAVYAEPTPAPPTATPTPEVVEEEEPTPAPEPEPEPTSQPQPATIAVTVGNGGNVRAAPTVDSDVVGGIVLGDTVEVVQKTPDGFWYEIITPQGTTGWTSDAALAPDPAQVAQIPTQGQDGSAQVNPGDMVGTVAYGGNMRASPNLSAPVVDLVDIGETLQLMAKTSDGIWYQVTAPDNQVGWVHVSLLSIDPVVISQVPIQG